MMRKILQRTPIAVALLLAAVLALLVPGVQAEAAELRLEPDLQTEQIFALPGVLRAASGQPYDTELVTANGDVFAVVGETPAVEDQLDGARDARPPVPVKVWGTLYPNGRLTTTPEIVVSAVQVSGPVPEPTPTTPRATVTAPVVNMRAGPSTDYPVIGQLNEGQSCDITGRNRAGTWWLVACTNNVSGWVAGQLVATTGSTSNVPILNVAPPPQPTPTPAPAGCAGWNASFFANRDLLGSPTVVDCVATINFNWGTSAPYPQMPPNNWSARFDRTINFGPGTYRFSAVSDDGVRVYVDGERIIDGWREQSPTQYTADRTLSGAHNIRVEYFQAGAGASLVLNIDFINASGGSGGGTGGGSGGGNVPNNAWLANYFNNVSLSGAPSTTRQEGRDSGIRWIAIGAPAHPSLASL